MKKHPSRASRTPAFDMAYVGSRDNSQNWSTTYLRSGNKSPFYNGIFCAFPNSFCHKRALSNSENLARCQNYKSYGMTNQE